MSIRNAAALLLVSALINTLGARVLDALGLIECILSPSGTRILIVLPVATLFFSARLCLYFVAPGLLLGAALDSARLRWRPAPRARAAFEAACTSHSESTEAAMAEPRTPA